MPLVDPGDQLSVLNLSLPGGDAFMLVPGDVMGLIRYRCEHVAA